MGKPYSRTAVLYLSRPYLMDRRRSLISCSRNLTESNSGTSTFYERGTAINDLNDEHF
jgi:hypothetical protein